MHFMILLLLLPSTIATSGSNSNSHTEIYNQWKDGTFIQTLFLPDTYLPFTSRPISRELACRTLSDDQTELRQQYIQLLTETGITCTGDWCDNRGKFSCATINPECYQVEHIIDKVTGDSELDSKNKNIVGNVIMAYGVWNNQVGQLKWSNVQQEKSEIYTKFLFETARHYVLTCNSTSNESILDMSSLVGIIFGSFVLLMVIVAIIVIARIEIIKPKSKLIPERVDVDSLLENIDDEDFDAMLNNLNIVEENLK